MLGYFRGCLEGKEAIRLGNGLLGIHGSNLTEGGAHNPGAGGVNGRALCRNM